MSTFKTEGVVCDGKIIVSMIGFLRFYTRVWKITCSAAGVRKIKSKHAGHLEPWTQTHLMIANGRLGYYRLATSTTINCFAHISHNLITLIAANNCIDMCDKAIQEDQPDIDAYQMLVSTLELLNEHASKYCSRERQCVQTIPPKRGGEISHEHERTVFDSEAVFLARAFGFKLLSHLGYKPELLICIVCKKTIVDGEVFFNALHGGLLEKTCMQYGMENYSLRINHEVIATLKRILQQPLHEVGTVRFSQHSFLLFSQIVSSF